MQYRRLGNSGLEVSVVGLGTNAFGRRIDEDASIRVVQAAIDCGINVLDTADVYGAGLSETYIGKAIKGKRDQVVVATKFAGRMGEGPNRAGGSRTYIRQAVEASLQRLDTDYIDLYQMHSYDPQTPIEETLSTLNDLVREGKVRYLGNSNFAGWQIADAAWVARANHEVPFVSAQNRYNLLEREAEQDIIPACLHFGLGLLPFFPLAYGLLTGKYKRGEEPPPGSRIATNAQLSRLLDDERMTVVESLQRFADDRGVSLLEVAIGGLAAKPGVSCVIAGATKPEQVEANAAAGEWVPTQGDMAEVDRLTGADAS